MHCADKAARAALRRRLRAAQPVRRSVRADPPRRGRAGRRRQADRDRDRRHAVRPRPAFGLPHREPNTRRCRAERRTKARRPVSCDSKTARSRSSRRATARRPPRADIKPGDIIFTIDKEPTYDLTLPEIEQKLHGPAGSEVALMLRRGTDTPLEVKVKRAAATSRPSTRGSNRATSAISAWPASTTRRRTRSPRRSRTAAAGRQQADRLHRRSAQQSRRQLRHRGQGGRCVHRQGRHRVVKSRKAESAKRIAATPGDLANGQPIVALVNGGTAREAELVAGALQDSRRAVLLGAKTFGESAIETLIPLNGNGAIRLTTARYLTPSGRPSRARGSNPIWPCRRSSWKSWRSPIGGARPICAAPEKPRQGRRRPTGDVGLDPARPQAARPGRTTRHRPRAPADCRHRGYRHAERRAAEPGDRRAARPRPGQRPHRLALIRRRSDQEVIRRVCACWDRFRARTD